MSAKLFSIIIPSYNYAQYLPRAVNSVTGQSGDDFEVIIIDDGSTDNTKKVADELLISCNKINYFYQENKGLAASRNAGVKESNGDYFIFLDADDELLPDALKYYREAVLAQPDKQFFIGGHQSVDSSNKVRENMPNTLSGTTRESLFSAYLFKKLSISAGAYTMHRSIFDRLQFPENLRSTEDIPMYGQTLALFDLAFIQQALVKIHKHDDSLRHNFNYAQAIGTNMVDVLFNDQVLPANFIAYKNKYFLKRCLSLSGLAYRAGAYSLSRKWFLTAVKTDKRALLKLSRLKKFIFSYFKKDSFEQ